VLAGTAARHVRFDAVDRQLLAALPLAVAIVTIEIGGTAGTQQGFAEASTFTSVDDFEAQREQLLDGRTRMMRAALDVVSEPGDPLLMWTSYPWPYLNLHRVAATRFIWKTFLLGEIYLARSGPEYVLPGTWETFAADVRRTDPVAFVVEAVNPVVPDTPFAALVDAEFATVFRDDVATLALRNDLADWMRSPAPDAEPLDPVSLGLGPGERATIAGGACVRIDAELVTESASATAVFRFGAPDPAAPALTLTRTPEGTAAVTSSGPVGAPFTVATPVAADTASLPVTLVAGARAAVLVVGGDVAGAVNIDPGGDVVVEAPAGPLALERMTRSDPPPGSGC
jgi:hypothetical protein